MPSGLNPGALILRDYYVSLLYTEQSEISDHDDRVIHYWFSTLGIWFSFLGVCLVLV